jgi:hypothetical protein
MSWSKETRQLIEQIAEHILLSDFEAAEKLTAKFASDKIP